MNAPGGDFVKLRLGTQESRQPKYLIALRATADCDMHLYVDALRRSAPLFERFRSFGDEGSRTCARRELLRVEAEMHGARPPSGLQYANNSTRTNGVVWSR